MTLSPNVLHILLDIEGTTCPVDFVSEVLFPYANNHLLFYLKQHQSDPWIRSLLAEIQIAWQEDENPEAMALAQAIQKKRTPAVRSKPNGPLQEQDCLSPEQGYLSPEEASLYLQWLIRNDRKLTPLKELQGLIWEDGYQKGQLIAPLFADVPAALQRWQQQGRILSVYSSGSVRAQKLLYSYSNAGDLSPLFSSWFDTRTGPKNEIASYVRIAEALQANPAKILFISDSPAELTAARNANLQTVFSRRPGNPVTEAGDFPILESFRDL